MLACSIIPIALSSFSLYLRMRSVATSSLNIQMSRRIKEVVSPIPLMGRVHRLCLLVLVAPWNGLHLCQVKAHQMSVKRISLSPTKAEAAARHELASKAEEGILNVAIDDRGAWSLSGLSTEDPIHGSAFCECT